jgi:hypothetical protein
MEYRARPLKLFPLPWLRRAPLGANGSHEDQTERQRFKEIDSIVAPWRLQIGIDREPGTRNKPRHC